MLHGNSIQHHGAVHVSLILTSSPWTGTYDNADILSCKSQKETSSELLCSVRVEEVDEGKTLSGTMLEVHEKFGVR